MLRTLNPPGRPSVGFIGHAVRQLCGYAGMIYGYAAGRYTVIGHVALWFAAIRHFAVGCFHILCR